MSKIGRGPQANSRCRSQKHLAGSSLGGCGDPRCPEGLYRDSLIAEALASKDFTALFDAAERKQVVVEEIRKATAESELDAANGWVQVDFGGQDIFGSVRLNPQRAFAQEIVKVAHSKAMPNFETPQELEHYVTSAYEGEVSYRVEEVKAGKLRQFEIVDLSVPPDMRGLGIAPRLRTAALSLGEKLNCIVSGTPTTGGDGRYFTGSPLFLDAAKKHHLRLRAAYYKSGYVDNPFFQFWEEEDQDTNPLTGEALADASEAQRLFTADAEKILWNAGAYIRFPKGKVPAGVLRPGVKFNTIDYRRY